jgi:hypothetical protein
MQGVNTGCFAGVSKSAAVGIQWPHFLRCPHKGQYPPAIRHCLFGVNPNPQPALLHAKKNRPSKKLRRLKKYPISKCRIPTIEFLTFFQKQKNKLNQAQQTP